MTDIYGSMNRIMNNLLVVFTHLRKNCFTATNDIEFDIAFKRVKRFFSLETSEAALFTFIFICYFDWNERPVNIGILAANADTTPLRFLEFRDEFDSLEEKGFIDSDIADNSDSMSKFYRIPEGVVNAVVKNDEHLLVQGLRVKDKNLIYPADIIEKEMYYIESIKREVESFTQYLSEDHLCTIQARLEEKSLSKGVCVMLHGASGTGKTETVYQIAKKTNRAIYHIDIGSVISCWHGGTERNLSALFDKYSRLCRQAKARDEGIPILLFNEADALFGRRIARPSQGSEIDENHIQSVLLDYLEKQEGIVVATTNIADNFDEAFERRFLFKIKFDKPNLETKKKIWKNKVKWLNNQDVEHLAKRYALSGAEIDNVVRKATMNEVLTGKRSSMKKIEEYCQKEKLEENTSRKIGFDT